MSEGLKVRFKELRRSDSSPAALLLQPDEAVPEVGAEKRMALPPSASANSILTGKKEGQQGQQGQQVQEQEQVKVEKPPAPQVQAPVPVPQIYQQQQQHETHLRVVSDEEFEESSDDGDELENEDLMGPLRESALSPKAKISQPIALAHEWTMWFDKISQKPKDSKDMYDDCIVELGSFDTVKGFWSYWNSLNVEKLKDCCNLRVFRKGVKPLSEDPHNINGGKWVVRGVPAGLRGDLWTDMALVLISEKLQEYTGNTVCGAVLSTREEGDSLQVWVDGRDDDTEFTRRSLKRLFFPRVKKPYANFIYQTHQELQGKPTLQEVEEDLEIPYDLMPTSPTEYACKQGAPAQAHYYPPRWQQNQEQQRMFSMLPPSMHQQPMFNAQQFIGSQSPVISPVQHPLTRRPSHSESTGASTVSSTDPSLGESFDDDESGMPFDGELPEDIRVIQERAKQIRTLKKRIRYISFFLQRQCKGRELTMSEKQKIKSLPQLQNELQLLDAQQQQEVEVQKQVLGVDNLDFLRKPQQAMVYSSESEKRFKLIRSLKKKVRFVHYHLERQKQGKPLSAAEQAKVTSLPELEAALAELEAMEGPRYKNKKKKQQLQQQQHTPQQDSIPMPAHNLQQMPHMYQSMTPGSESLLPVKPTPSFELAGLQAQIDAQRKELEDRQRRIESIIKVQRNVPPHGAPPPPQQQYYQGPYHQPPPMPVNTFQDNSCHNYYTPNMNIHPHAQPMPHGYYNPLQSPSGGPPPLESPVMSPPMSPNSR